MIRFYAMHDEDGVIYGYRRTSTDYRDEPGYTEVTNEQHQIAIRNGRQGFRVIDGQVIRGHEIRLSASNQILVCDGETEVEITALRVPDDAWPIGLSINGKHYDVQKGEPLLLVSSEVGAWVVDVDDDRFTCEEAVRIDGLDPADLERRRARGGGFLNV